MTEVPMFHSCDEKRACLRIEQEIKELLKTIQNHKEAIIINSLQNNNIFTANLHDELS